VRERQLHEFLIVLRPEFRRRLRLAMFVFAPSKRCTVGPPIVTVIALLKDLMQTSRFDQLTRQLSTRTGRRRVVQTALVLGASVIGVSHQDEAEAATLCLKDGSQCKTKSSTCQTMFCLKAPFTIEARWSSDSNHDIYLFVPKQSGSGDPGPYINYSCDPAIGFYETCDTEYPFACGDGDQGAGGDEIMTVHKLLPGHYEFWVSLYSPADRAAGDLSVKVRNRDGRILRTWKSPAFPGGSSYSWHVCDIAGNTRSLKSVDVRKSELLPDVARYPNTDVCPVHI